MKGKTDMRGNELRTRMGVLIAIAAFGIASLGARGATAIFTGTSGSLAAEADFSLVGNQLTVTLINTSSGDVQVPTDVLTALLFNSSSGLTPVSASLNGSSVWYASIVQNVGEGWAYGHPVSAHGMNSGISATGLNIFDLNSPTDNFYNPPKSPIDGIDYGILSAGDNSATGNGGITSGGPLIKNSIQFVLTAASGFSLSQLGSSVVFQYGTDLSEPSFGGTITGGDVLPVPEPATVIAGALLLLPFGVSTVRILRRNRAA